MFGYKAALQQMNGESYWMIYWIFFWVPFFQERCNSEEQCKRRLGELRNKNMAIWLPF